MTDERLSALRAELYERFLREDGAIKLRAKSWGDQLARASVLAAVGNFPAAFEMIKNDKGGLRFDHLNWITHICHKSFFGGREWKRIKTLDALGFLLWRGYVNAAREWVTRFRCPEKWRLFLRIYKMTRDPGDLEKVREASFKARGKAEELLRMLMEIFDASQSCDDWLRVEKGFLRFEKKLTWAERREYWLWHYGLTGLQSDQDEANRLRVIIEQDRKVQAKAKAKRVREMSKTSAGLLSLWHNTGNRRYLIRAIEKLLADPTQGQFEQIFKLIEQINVTK